MKRTLITSSFLATLLVAGAFTASAASAAPAPVGETIAPPIACGNSVSKPPVVLLPGGDGTTTQTTEQVRTLKLALEKAGNCTLVFQSGIVDGQRWLGSAEGSAKALQKFVEDVKATTKSAKVNIVAHSAGTIISNYYLKVLKGFPNVKNAVFLAAETNRCDGAGFVQDAVGVPFPLFPLFKNVPQIPEAIGVVAPPQLAGPLQFAPGSPVFKSVFESGPITQPGVKYSVLASKHDELATPVGTCSFIPEPGVKNEFYDDVFPKENPVNHSGLRASPKTAEWVIKQLS